MFSHHLFTDYRTTNQIFYFNEACGGLKYLHTPQHKSEQQAAAREEPGVREHKSEQRAAAREEVNNVHTLLRK